MDYIERVLKENNILYISEQYYNSIRVVFKNIEFREYNIVFREIDHNNIKMICTNFAQYKEYDEIIDNLYKFNKNLPIGNFYYELESMEIRLQINLSLQKFDKEYQILKYILSMLNYAKCIYGEYYMIKTPLAKMAYRTVITHEPDLVLYYFIEDIECIEKSYKIKSPICFKTKQFILNACNLKTNRVYARIKGDRLIVRGEIPIDSPFRYECLDHIEEYYKWINSIINI